MPYINANTTIPVNPTFNYSNLAYNNLLGGSYVGKALRKIVYGNKYKLKGAKYPLKEKIEINGTATDPHVVYISMGPNIKRVAEGVSRILMYALFQHCDYEISNFDLDVERVFTIRTTYYINYEAVSPTTNLNFDVITTTSDTLKSIAALWLAALQTATTSNVVIDIQRMALFSNDTGGQSVRMGEIDLKKIYIKMISKYALLFQNQTAGGTATDTESTDVSNNPVHVTHVQVLGNAFIEKERSESNGEARPATYKPWIHFGSTNYKELIVRTAAGQWSTPQYQAGRVFVNTKKSNQFILNPGQMKKLQMTTVESHSLYEWIALFYKFFAATTPSVQPIRFAGSRMLIFDKMINTGENVIISYELNITNSFGYRLNTKEHVMPTFYDEEI